MMETKKEPMWQNADAEDDQSPAVQMEFPRQGIIQSLKWIIMIANGIFAAGQILAILLVAFLFDKFKQLVKQQRTQTSYGDDQDQAEVVDTAFNVVLVVIIVLLVLNLGTAILGFLGAYKEHVVSLIIYGVLEGIYAFLLLFLSRYVFFVLYLALSVCAFVSVKFIRDKHIAFARIPTKV